MAVDNTDRDEIVEVPPDIVHNAVHDIPQAMAVRFMELGSNGDLYTVLGRNTVQRWHREETDPKETFHTSDPINGFAIRDNINAGDYTHAFLAHDRGKTGIWRSTNLDKNRGFNPQSTLQTMRTRMSNWLPAIVRNNNPPTVNTITCLCLSEDREFLYAASTKGVIYVWWIGTDGGDKLADRIGGYNGEVLSLAAGPNVVFSGSSDGRVRKYKRELHAARHKVTHTDIGWFAVADPGHRRSVTALAFEGSVDDPTRGRLYAGCTDGRVRCWKNLRVDVLTVWPVPEIMQHHTGVVTCVALCSDRFVFSGANDGRICVWRRHLDNANHTIEKVMVGPNNPINCIVTRKDTWTEFPEDAATERWILYGGSLDRIRIWHVDVPVLGEFEE